VLVVEGLIIVISKVELIMSGDCKVMKIKPLHDRVVIQRLDQEDMSAGGIVLPDTAQEKPMRGKVVAMGPGKMLDDGKVIPMAIKQGEEVLFGKYSGTEVKMDGIDYMVMREDDIMGVIE
jgi:chaperonin GroES